MEQTPEMWELLSIKRRSQKGHSQAKTKKA